MPIKFTSDKSTLLSLIGPAMYATSNKSTLPALEGLLFNLKGDELSVCGYDQEKGIKTHSFVNGREDGTIILNSAKISGIIKNLPDCEITFDCNEKNIVTIIGEDSNFAIHGIDSVAFPTIPELNGENRTVIKAKVLRDLISSTCHAVSTNDSRPVFMGEQFKIENGDLTVVATDNFCMAIKKAKGCVKSEKDSYSVVIPGKALNDLVRLTTDSEDEIIIEFTRKHVIFKCMNLILFSRLLEGEFLDYKKVIPSPGKTFVKINRQAFIESVERASLLIDEKMKTPLVFMFSDNVLEIFCSTQYGKVNDTVKVELEGENIEIGFNNRFVLDALRACKDEEVRLTLFSPLMAMIITPAEKKEENDFLYLVLPRRLKD